MKRVSYCTFVSYRSFKITKVIEQIITTFCESREQILEIESVIWIQHTIGIKWFLFLKVMIVHHLDLRYRKGYQLRRD